MPKNTQYTLLYIFLCCFTGNFLNAQENFSLNDYQKIYQGKEAWIGNNDVLEDFFTHINYDEQPQKGQKIYFRIPVKIWVHTNDDESVTDIHEEVIQQLKALNNYHELNQTGFTFYLLEQPEIVIEEKNAKTGYYLEGPLYSMANKETDAINIHLIEKLVKPKLFGPDKTVRATYNSITNAIFLTRKGAKTTLTHEIGHFFGLLHTHENSGKGKCKQEPVSRNRKFEGCLNNGIMSESTGDNLRDTPADPGLKAYTTEECNLLIAQYDEWGDRYTPLADNLMSYTRNLDCRTSFTRMQKAVMLYSAFEMQIPEWIHQSDK